ncbi:PH (Pleckstrin Homology) domain-containing protein [Curtobacterium sp. PhB142]|uniref:PH domain-containing protein n=1 Tax=unclassified Curtobacterium TaxID=257496 RepID=UPI00104C89C9|nr:MULTISPECIES: PH domain-containing protein [unclassified Curtobacterium]TCL87523.1 PH (Pleckstrin Homology) domain-containing protein [Curtobacterium sp. PhB142]TCM05128.1 PH (Pleckstrin Homology) domain-containing protein [Curtobacterium sp. PhB134]
MHTTIVTPGLRRLAIVLWVVAVALVPLALLDGSTPWLVPIPSICVAFVAWAALWRPRIELTPEHLRIVDVRRTSTYTWSRVTEVRTKYGIEVVTSEGVRRVWIATRPTARLTAQVQGRPGGPDHLDVDAAAAQMLARVPVPAQQDGPPPATVTAAPITHRVHGWTVLAFVVLGIAASLAAARM